MKRAFFIFFLILCGFGGWVAFSLWELPDEEAVKNYRPTLTTEVIDSQGNILAQYFHAENRLWVPLQDISPYLIDAVVVAEDDTFFQHKGLNYREIFNAMIDDLKRWRFARGASTITQQLARNAFLTRKKSLIRKMKEVLLAMRIERTLTKQRILELYLNEVEWGDSIYGAEAASRYYLDKHVSELNLEESALLAAMLPSPRAYNPFNHLTRAVQRQKEILARMFQYHTIDDSQLASALNAVVVLRQQDNGHLPIWTSTDRKQRKCWENTLEKYLEARIGMDRLYTAGLKITVTLSAPIQKVLDKIVTEETSETPFVLIVAEGKIHRGFSCVKDKEEANATARAIFRNDHIPRGASFHLVDREWFLTKARLM